ncbi:ABC-type sugar transport system, periplasmic component [Butyrivibrio fibrisolvens 16/4]|nr:ABC-type sugar transport system, periplasmic component [Butyrivibrio fibrisolvens 16/4]
MRGQSRRLISIIVLVTLMITTVVGCKGAKEKPFAPRFDESQSGSIKVYGSYSNFEALESEFERFNEYYPNVELSYIYLDGYRDAIGNSLLSVEAPDIYCTFYWMWENPECEDIFEAAEDLAAADYGIDFSSVRDGIVRKTDEGKVLMAPVLATSFGMLVNNDLFEKEGLQVPNTWSDFEKVCDKFKAAGYDSPVMGYVSTASYSFEYNFAYPSLCNSVVSNPSMRDSFNNLEPEAGELMRPSLEKLKKMADAENIDVKKCEDEIVDNYDSAIMRFF